MTARSRALAVAVVLVALALGLGAGVAAADDLGTQDDVTVHLVGDDDEEDGLDTITLFEDEVPETYDIEYIDVADVDLGVIGETDIFVFYDTDEDEDLITTVEEDPTTGAVYLDQWGSTSTNGIPDRSAVTGDPEETDDTSLGFGISVEYTIEEDHPIFEGVADANETVQITDDEENHAWFEGASGDTLATVGTDDEDEPSGSSVAVDPETGSVLLSSIAVDGFSPALDDLTAEAGEILGNAVEFAESDTEEPFFAVSDLDAPAQADPGTEIDVSATVTNIGTETGTQDIEFVFDNETVLTDEDVTLDPGENVTVAFEPTLPDEIGLFEHGVFTDDDSQTAEIGVGVEFVGVVEDGGDGAETAALFADELPDRFAVEVVDSEDVVEDDLVDFYDIFVFHDFGFEDEEEIIPAVENDVTTGAVYLDQDGFTSNAISDRSDVIGDPESTDDGPFGTDGPMEYELVQPEHPIFDGIDAPDDVFEIHDGDDIAWFENASGDTLAEVVDESGEVGGSAVAVDPDSGSVLLSSIATQTGLGPSQFTEAANQTLANAVEVAEPDIEGAFFEVSDLDAPGAAPAGAEIDVSATITNVGPETGTQDVDFVFNGEVALTEEDVTLDPEEATTVAFEPTLPEEIGLFEHGVFTDDDEQTAEIGVGLDVLTVVESGGDGAETLGLFEDDLPEDSYLTQVVDAEDVTNQTIDETDVFVFHQFAGDDTGPENRTEADTSSDEELDAQFQTLIETVEDDVTTGAVYLDQWSSTGTIPDRSETIGDPEDTGDVISGDDVVFDVLVEHPIFDGVANASETVPISVPGESIDYAFFTGADGETLAEVGEDGAETDGEAVAVDPESGSVLLSTIAVQTFAPAEDFTAEAGEILANAAVFGTPDLDEDFFEVSDLDAPAEAAPGDTIDVSATVTNIGNEAGTQDVDFVFDDAVAGTEENVTLEPGAETTVEFEPTLPEEEGVFEHGVFTANDSQTADIDIAPPFFAVSDLDAPAEAGPGAEIDVTATVTNTGNGADTQDVEFVFDNETVATDEDVTLEPGENTTVEFLDIALPDEEGEFEHGVFTDDDNQTAEIAIFPEFFEVSELSAPAAGAPGEEINVSATVTNTGNEVGTQDVVYVSTFAFGDDEVITEPAVTLDPGENVTVAFEPTLPEEVGSFEHGVFTDDDNQTAEISVEEAFFAVSDLDAPAQADPGAEIDVSATVTNTGQLAGTQDVEFVFDDAVAGTEENVTLDPGAETTVAFENVSLPETVGLFEHGIFTDDDSQTAEIEVGETEAEIELSVLQQPETLGLDDPIAGSVTVTNTGTAPYSGEFLMVLRDDFAGDGIEQAIFNPPAESLELDPGESTTVSDDVLNFTELNNIFEDNPDIPEFEPGDIVPTGFQVGEEDLPGFLDDELDDELLEDLFITTDEGSFFEVSELDAPAEVDPGVEIDIEATVTNIGPAAGTQDVEFVFDNETVATEPGVELDSTESQTVAFENVTVPEEEAFYEHGVFTDDDNQTAVIGVGVELTTVTVVESGGDGAETLGLFEDELPGTYETPQVVDATNVTEELIDETDTFVFHDFAGDETGPSDRISTDGDALTASAASGEEPDVDFEDLIETVEDDITTGAVYLEQYFGGSSAISDRSEAIGDPEDIGQSIFGDDVVFDVLVEHPIFDGVANASETVPIGVPGQSIDYAWFTGADGETLAEVGEDGAETDGEAVAVDPESGSVLLSTIAVDTFAPAGSFTAEAGEILGNAVVFAEPDVEPAVFEVSDLDAPAVAPAGGEIDVSATITNTGGEVGTQDVEFVFDDETAATEENVTLDPEEATTVTFEDIPLPDAVGVFGHGVFTDDDSQTAEISIEEEFFAVSDLDAPAEAGAGETIEVTATVTNTGNVTGTQEVTFEFDGDVVDEEPLTLDPDEDDVVEFEPTLPEEGGTFEHGVFTDDDSQTAEITVTEPPAVELSNLSIAGEGENATVLEGDHEVSAEMTHVGGGAGEVETTLTIGDDVEETATVDIEEGETVDVSFEDVTTELGPGVYDVEMTAQDETLTGELTISVDVGDDETPATDTTGDGLLNDLTGDGEFTIMDVQTLFENFDGDAIQNNVELFDFLGDDRVTIFDVQALFNQLQDEG